MKNLRAKRDQLERYAQKETHRRVLIADAIINEEKLPHHLVIYFGSEQSHVGTSAGCKEKVKLQLSGGPCVVKNLETGRSFEWGFNKPFLVGKVFRLNGVKHRVIRKGKAPSYNRLGYY